VVVTQQACPDLVPLVEAGELSGPRVEAAVGGYLDELLARDPELDTLLLGCTHYPLLRPVFERHLGPRVSVVDSAFTTALALEDLLDALQVRTDGATGADGSSRIATTGDPRAFRAVARRFFGDHLPDVESVDIDPAASVLRASRGGAD
jgi:glutamate racemase